MGISCKKFGITVCVGICSMLFYGCSYKNTVISSNYTKDKFEMNESTVHKNNIVINKEYSNNYDMDEHKNDDEPSYTGEIDIDNSSDKKDFFIHNNDIVYLTKTFKDLNTNIDKIGNDTPYTKNELINFITKVLYREFTSDIISTTLSKDPEEPEDEYTTVNDLMESIPSYNNLCNKYNDIAVWQLDLLSDSGEQFIIIGCKSFIAALNQEGNMNIDMSEYQESGIPNVILNDGTIVDGDDYVNQQIEHELVDNAISNYTEENTEDQVENEEQTDIPEEESAEEQ